MYKDKDMMQRCQELEDNAQMIQTKSSEMMDRGNAMMQMMK